jgi:hypothetical protein
MRAVEFETRLTSKKTLPVPRDAARRLPASGKARVIVLIAEDDAEDAVWRRAAYEQFMSDDAPEDAVYDRYAKGR